MGENYEKNIYNYLIEVRERSGFLEKELKSVKSASKLLNNEVKHLTCACDGMKVQNQALLQQIDSQRLYFPHNLEMPLIQTKRISAR